MVKGFKPERGRGAKAKANVRNWWNAVIVSLKLVENECDISFKVVLGYS